jgi:hypothetical protein
MTSGKIRMTNQVRMTNDEWRSWVAIGGIVGLFPGLLKVLASFVVVVVIFTSAPCAAAVEAQLTTLDGRKLEGAIKELAADRVILTTDEGETSFGGDDLHLLAPKEAPEKAAAKPSAWVEFVDGSRLPAASYLSANGKVTIGMLDGKELEVAGRQIRSVRFGRLDERDADIGREEAAGDLLGIRKRDNVDFLEGVVGDVTAESVEFTLEGEKIPVNRSKVEGVVYAHKVSGEEVTPACVIEDSAGGLMKAKSVRLRDDVLEIVLLAGPTLQRPFSEIRKIDFSAGKLVYLSELKPESVDWTSFFDLGTQAPSLARFMAPRFDRGREDEVMRLGGKDYKKGVSLTSRTELVYRLPARAKRFKALVGIDDRVGNLGSVQLVIRGDNRELYSRKITGKDEPMEIDADLAGVRRLTILVDFGDDLDVADHLNLCEARIVK